ncbi:pfkB family kinase [Penicillium angulare]|uniref:PfkB family kinase n=1 Tax=Penicillium angulare TaxID=116970 RepID=A0A9W9K5A1_9EURO|nr:pfkB family kinase [Penicillium angulare]
MSLVAVGACYLDTILSTPYYPGEDEKLRASSITHRRGGNCPNSLEVLKQLIPISNLPLSLSLITVLPSESSAATQQIRSTLEPNVCFDHCIYREGFQEPASSYIIASRSTGSRTIVNYNELPDMTIGELTGIIDGMVSKATWFHFEGRIPDVILGCIQHLRKEYPLVRISVEIEKPGRKGLQELAEAADVTFYSKTWAQVGRYLNEELENIEIYRFSQLKPQLKIDNHAAQWIHFSRGLSTKTVNEDKECVCLCSSTAWMCLRRELILGNTRSLLFCTWGQDGAAAFEPSTGQFVHAEAYTTTNFRVVDPIGAGDTFNAGMLYALSCRDQEWDLRTKVRFANRIAGMKVSQEGFSGLDRALNCYPSN